jgi:hypothetical protein
MPAFGERLQPSPQFRNRLHGSDPPRRSLAMRKLRDMIEAQDHNT